MRHDTLYVAAPFSPGQLDLPFFTDDHRRLAARLCDWVATSGDEVRRVASLPPMQAARLMVELLARDGWLSIATGDDMRAICLCRQAFAWVDDLCDLAFSLQGLAAHPLKAAGRSDLVASLAGGQMIGALALTEPGAGSDLAAVATRAEKTTAGYLLSGEKAWIGHAGVADIIVTLARTAPGGAFGLSLLAVPGNSAGVLQSSGPDLLAPRALGSVVLDAAFVPDCALLDSEGMGFVHALQTIEAFRMTVGAAACGFALRALQAAVDHTGQRRVEGKPLSDMQLVRASLADMAVALSASQLLVAQAAWQWDTRSPVAATRSAMAKLHATEAAQEIIDRALQLHGAAGLAAGSVTERLYRQIRSLRIYEGTSEIHRLTIGQAVSARRV
ncbi:MAG: acyl-CoA dehydrogenase family protein [Paracoccaceae bacterium]